MKNDKKRIYFLDELRGFAIICMIFHHAFLDIGDLLGYNWGYEMFDRLCTVQPIFWGIFIIISGMCTRLSRNTIKRGAIVFGGAMVITLVTGVIMPLVGFNGAEIYFGILHCLGLCMIFTGLIMPLINKIDYRVGAVISLALFFFSYGISAGTLCFGLIELPLSLYQHNFLFPFGIFSPTFYSADYFALIPWIFLFLFGAFVGKLAVEELLPQFMYKKHSKTLCFIGKNTLWIYLGHQPVLYALIFASAIIVALLS